MSIKFRGRSFEPLRRFDLLILFKPPHLLVRCPASIARCAATAGTRLPLIYRVSFYGGHLLISVQSAADAHSSSSDASLTLEQAL